MTTDRDADSDVIASETSLAPVAAEHRVARGAVGQDPFADSSHAVLASSANLPSALSPGSAAGPSCDGRFYMALTMDQKRAEAHRLRAEGLLLREIAERLGYAHAESVVRLLRDPEHQSELLRRSNAKRAAAKRAWEREHDRGTCPCGASMGVGSQRRGCELCRACHDVTVAVGRAMREERIADMWAQGLKLREIAAALDSTTGSIGRSVAEMRRRGWDVPYRNNWPEASIEAVREAERAAVRRRDARRRAA